MGITVNLKQDKYPLSTWLYGMIQQLDACKSATTLTDEQKTDLNELEGKILELMSKYPSS